MQAVGHAARRAGLRRPGRPGAGPRPATRARRSTSTGSAKLLASGGLDRGRPALPAGPAAVDAAAQAELLAAGGGPTRVTMNCSGKHAAMLLTCRGQRLADRRLLRPGAPAAAAHRRHGRRSWPASRSAATGVDGCGAPVLALSLAGLAGAFLRLVEAAPGSRERAVADAMRALPGAGLRYRRRRRPAACAACPALLAKGGAEGVLAVAVPGVGRGGDQGGRRCAARPGCRCWPARCAGSGVDRADPGRAGRRCRRRSCGRPRRAGRCRAGLLGAGWHGSR